MSNSVESAMTREQALAYIRERLESGRGIVLLPPVARWVTPDEVIAMAKEYGCNSYV